MAEYRADKQARIAAGLCFECGEPRAGAGCTKVRCALCSEKARVRAKAWWAKRLAAESAEGEAARLARDRKSRGELREARRERKRCTRCGRQLTGREVFEKVERCAACQKDGRERCALSRRRKRLGNPQWAGYRGGEALPVGRAVTVGVVRHYTIYLDSGAFAALRELKKRDLLARRAKAAREGRKAAAVEVVFQTSRVIREAVGSWAEVAECPTRTASYRKMIEAPTTIGADARMVAAVERHKGARGGNLAATICDLLAGAAGRQQWVAKGVGKRLSAGGGESDAWDAWDAWDEWDEE